MERDARYSTLSVVIFNHSYRLLLPRSFVNGYRKMGQENGLHPTICRNIGTSLLCISMGDFPRSTEIYVETIVMT